MTEQSEKNDEIQAAVRKISGYVEQTTGQAASDAEIARALTRYFVLKEIGEFIAMERKEAIEKQ